MNGKRVYPNENGELPFLVKGEYGEFKKGEWLLCCPNGLHGRINDKTWKITENEDKTITVSPSIFVSINVPDTERLSWHGYLTNGIWKEC